MTTTTATQVPSPTEEVAQEAPAPKLPVGLPSEAAKSAAWDNVLAALVAVAEKEGWTKPGSAPQGPFGKVVGAIAAVMADLTPVEKGGKNTFHNYKYARMQDILQTLTPLMGKHGLAVFQYEIDRQMFDDGKVLAIRYNFVVAHSSGESWIHPVPQTGMSPCRTSAQTGNKFDDKSFAKAHTSARKYFLLSLFQVPTEDEADPDNEKSARGRASAPVPSPDGHVAPHLIEPMARDTFDAWADRYLAGVRTSRSIAEVEAWDHLNDDPLAQMDSAEKGKPVYDRILKECAAIRARMQQTAPAVQQEPSQTQQAATVPLESIVTVPPAQVFVRPADCPNADQDPEGYVKWSMKKMDGVTSSPDMDSVWQNEISAFAEGLFKTDWDTLQAYRDDRLSKIGG